MTHPAQATAEGRCEPPEGLRGHGTWHWLIQGRGKPEAVIWTGRWFMEGFLSPVYPREAFTIGYRYLFPVPTPDELAALVRAARLGRRALDALTGGPGGRDFALEDELEKIDAALSQFKDIVP